MTTMRQRRALREYNEARRLRIESVEQRMHGNRRRNPEPNTFAHPATTRTVMLCILAVIAFFIVASIFRHVPVVAHVIQILTPPVTGTSP